MPGGASDLAAGVREALAGSTAEALMLAQLRGIVPPSAVPRMSAHSARSDANPLDTYMLGGYAGPSYGRGLSSAGNALVRPFSRYLIVVCT